MENQPIEQTSGQPIEQSVVQAVEPKSSATVWYIVGAVIVIAALAMWYVYSTQTAPVNTETPTATTQTPPTGETQTAPLTSGNTTSDISADLNQPDSSSELDTDAAASASALQSL